MKTGYLVLTALFFISPALTALAGQDNPVLVKVNDGQITAEQFTSLLKNLPPQSTEAILTDEKAERLFVDDLIGIELVVQEARKHGLDKTEAFKKNQEAFKQSLGKGPNAGAAKKDMSLALEENAKNQLFSGQLKKALGDKLAAIPAPTDDEIAAYYKEHADQMVSHDGEKLTLAEVVPALKNKIIAERQRGLYLEYVQSLRATARISIDENALKKIRVSLSQTQAAKKRGGK